MMQMFCRRLFLSVAALLWLATTTSAPAATVIFSTTVDGLQETPPSGSPSVWSGPLTMDTALNTLSYTITMVGPPLLGPEIGAHIHGFAPPGVPAGILHALPAGSPKIGVWNFLEAQEASIIADLTYVNIHSALFPVGEVRGQIVRVPSCGDTVVDGPGEGCDDGNNTSGDGCSATCQTETTDVAVVPTKLIVVDNLVTATSAKVVFVSKDSGVIKGSAVDVTQIEARLDVTYDSAAGAFIVPSGASNGMDGWLVNGTTVAKYVNKGAPGGPTQTKVAVIKPTKLLKLVGKQLGDVALDILGQGAPSGSVFAAYTVDNAGEVIRHCAEFPNANCTYSSIAAGTGAKLVCKGGVGDPACTAAP
jgi:cysteine-rich repeat protein